MTRISFILMIDDVRFVL